MTAQHDLDRALAGWFAAEATTTPPPEPLARVLASTRSRRPRPWLLAGVGGHWVGTGPTSRVHAGLGERRPAVLAVVVALLALALVGGALLVAGRLVAPRTPHVYLDEVASAPDLSMPMANPALVPLLDGRVLVVGDDGDGGGQGTRALVYDPATGTSEATGPLVSGDTLWVQSAVGLSGGKVLVIGDVPDGETSTTIAQVFDPATLQFVAAGPMITPRSMAGVVALPDGRALVVGGHPSGQEAASSAAELFDPETLTFSPTGSMGTTRSAPSLAVLPDGRVFVSPGESRTTVETYDPRTGAFSPAGSVPSSMVGDSAMALPDGRVVLIRNGSFGTISLRTVADTWDPTTLSFTERNLPEPVTSRTLLDDERVLLIGGTLGNWAGTFDLTTGKTTPIRNPKAWHPKATRLPDGRVLIAGGLLDGNLRDEGGGSTAPGVSTVEIFQ
jgi:hypothetical protein